MKTCKEILKVLTNIFAFLVAIFNVGGAILSGNASAINAFFNIATSEMVKDESSTQEAKLFYDSAYKTYDDLNEKTRELAVKVMGESLVLLKNDHNALPLDRGASLNLYGAGSYNFAFFGNGSSGYALKGKDNYASVVDLKTGLEEGGDFNVNAGLWNWYKSNSNYWQGADFSGNRTQTTKYTVKDATWNQITASTRDTAADAGILVISRNSGENADRDLSYACLAPAELDVLKGMKGLKDRGILDTIVVLVNSANPIEMDFADDSTYGVDAVLWCGLPGHYGNEAIGQVLCGEVNPSGKLSDTYWIKNNKNPVYTNVGETTFGNSSLLTSFVKGENKKYVVYQEGIYNGYRYTETRYEDYVLNRDGVGNFDYEETVAYPFGYGLSYTDFEYSNLRVNPVLSASGGKYKVSLTVKNTGTVAGKEVVQIYLQKPYTQYDIENRIEKASVELVGFAKTKLLAKGQSQTVSVDVDEKYFASYDAYKAKTYVLDAGNYYLTAAGNSHEAINNILEIKATAAQKGEMTARGNADLVYNCTENTNSYKSLDTKKYSTNEVIKTANTGFTPKYAGQEANYGVQSITNRFDDTDFTLYDGIQSSEQDQSYITRSDWEETAFTKITLTATLQLAQDQRYTNGGELWIEEDTVEYPTFGAQNGLSLINLRNYDDGSLIEYNNPIWEQLLDQITWDEMVALLQDGLRQTKAVPGINAPATHQYNGATGPVPEGFTYDSSNPTNNEFKSFSEYYDDGQKEIVPTLPSNVNVASTYNVELIEEFGRQVGEECAWCGMNGIYGLGVNIHRGALCGRAFEYYSEDGFLAGMASAYEGKGMQTKGVFVILKHCILNDQETARHGICSWSNEQAIREIYLRPAEIAVELGDEMGMMGMMTGLNRLGAKWTGSQGFCATVMRGEFGMQGYIISDFYKEHMNPIAGVLGGNDLIDGDSTGKTGPDGTSYSFNNYKEYYGKVAWAMRESAHRILYTVVRSNAMNLITSDMKVINITPVWQTAVQVVTLSTNVLFALSCGGYVVLTVLLSRKSAV